MVGLKGRASSGREFGFPGYKTWSFRNETLPFLGALPLSQFPSVNAEHRNALKRIVSLPSKAGHRL